MYFLDRSKLETYPHVESATDEGVYFNPERLFMSRRLSLLTVVVLLLAVPRQAICCFADENPVVETSKVDDPNVKLVAGTWKDVEALVAKNAGKIVVVDVWSTSCLPCMTEFPELVKMHREHGEKVVCISFNVDYVGIKSKPAATYEKNVQEFLQKHNATCTNILSTMPSDEIFQSLELPSIPAVYVYGTDGQLLKRFDDSLLVDGKEEAFTYKADIHPFVEKLLPDV